MSRFWEKLNQPFPEEGSLAQSFKSLIGVSIFVGLFLFLLKPFGLGTRSDLPTLSLGFGLVTFVVGLLHDLVVRRIIKLRTDLPSWTLGRWILNMLSVIISIALGNFIFMNWWSGWIGLDLPSLLQVLLHTTLVGIIPVVFVGLLMQNRETKKNALEARTINLSGTMTIEYEFVVIDDVRYSAQNLRFIEAQQNYVSIHFVDQGRNQQELVRMTFRKLEEILNGSSIVRCHRSFFVNKNIVVNIDGNAQGLKLTLKDLPGKSIPVSKSYAKDIKSALARP